MRKFLSINRLLFLGILFFTVPGNCYTQDNITYTYKNKFCFTLPSTLEVQYDDNVQSSYIIYSNDGKNASISETDISDRVVWQQKGLNNPSSKHFFDKYCRVITIYAETDPGDVPARYEEFTVDEEFWDEQLAEAEKETKKINLKIIKVLGFDVISVNGYPGYYFCYLRTGWKNAPPVVVYQYMIFNHNELCQISFSYRQSEAQDWAKIKNQIENSFFFQQSEEVETKSYNSPKENAIQLERDESNSNSIVYLLLIVCCIVILIVLRRYSKH